MRSRIGAGSKFCALVACLALGSFTIHARAPAAPDSWRTLFDGSTTKGWRTYGEATLRPQWQIVDGALTLTQAGGGDITFGEKIPGDFEFEVEWRVEPGGNSGILYFVDPANEKRPPYETGLEMQLLDNATSHDRFYALTRAGAMYALYGPSSEVANPGGAWNTARIRVEGPNVEQWLNGVRVVAANIRSDEFENRLRASKFARVRYPDFLRHQSGLIVLQDHQGSRVQFRNIRLRTF